MALRWLLGLMPGLMLLLTLALPRAGTAQTLDPSPPDTLLARLRRPRLPDSVRVAYLLSYGARQQNRNLPLALRYVEQARQLAQRKGLRPGLAHALLTLGGLEVEANQLPAGRAHLEQSLRLYQTLRNQAALARCYLDLGNVAASLADYPQALRYYQQSLRYNAQQTPVQRDQANILRYNMAGVYGEMRQPAQSARLLRQAAAGCRALRSYTLMPDVLVALGNLPLAAQRPDSARLRYRPGLTYLQPDNLTGASSLHTGLAQAALATRQPAEALREAQLALGQARQAEDLALQAEAQQALALALRQLGRPEAFDSLQRYLVLHDTLGRQERAEAVLTAQARFNSREQAAQIRDLQQRRRLAAQQVELTRLRTRQEQAGLGALALALAAGLVWRYRRRQAAQEAALRNRLAADLHDDVGTLLSQISMQSGILQEGLADAAGQRQQLDQISEASRAAIRQLNDVVWSLDAHNDALPNLLDRMRDYAYELLGPLGMAVSVVAPPELPARRLPVLLRRNLYLIHKEALHNIAKHAPQARTVAVALTLEEGKWLVLQIDDDGFPALLPDAAGASASAPARRSGHGLRNIAQRAAACGGTAETGRVFGGFRVRVRVPLSPE